MRTLKIRATKPQADFMALTCKFPLMVSGFGAGKSETMLNQAILDAFESPHALIGIYEPTYDLIRLIVAPRLCEKLTEFGIAFNYNKSENMVYTKSPQIGDFVLRTLDNPARIVGYETYRAHIDEIDTLKHQHAQDAWDKVIARNRQQPKDIAEPFNRVSAYTTPEGFKFAHKRWVTNGGGDYQYIQASTLSNPFLPDDYVQGLRDTYPPELIEAYINGEFVNLTSGTVYRSFDRETCASSETIQPQEPLFIGQDFNVGKMASVVYVKRGDVWHAVDELSDLFDTPDLIATINSRYKNHHITIYPDASGANRKTANASESDISLLRGAGYRVKVNSRNPRVKDRVMAVNSAWSHGKLKVNLKKCPEFVRCQEQQAYDSNGEPDKKAGFDHMNDGGGYPIAYEMPIKKPVSSVGVSFAI